jgi:hypothetical protein
MQKFCLFLACAAAASLSPAPAQAQSLPSPSALTVKAGVSAESNATLNQTGLALGVDYAFHPASALEPFAVSFYADLLGKSGGAGIAIRNAGPAYIGAGAGLYSTSLTHAYGGPAGGGSNANAGTATGFGGKIFAGFDVAPHTTLELGYHVLPQVNGISANTISAELGFRL